MNDERFTIMKELKRKAEQDYKTMLRGLVMDFKAQLDDLASEVLVGDMEGIRGSLEALKCIQSMQVDLVGLTD